MEYLTMDEAQDKFGSKGKANAGLTLGIIGTALGALGGGFGGLLGGGNTSAIAGNGVNGPTAYDVAQKECEDNIALTRAIYDGRITDLKEKFDLYKTLDDKISALSCQTAVTNAQLPLMFQLANVSSERYTDDSVAKAKACQNEVNFVFQRELDSKINGTMGLPWGDIITGIPKMPACTMGVTCPSTPA